MCWSMLRTTTAKNPTSTAGIFEGKNWLFEKKPLSLLPQKTRTSGCSAVRLAHLLWEQGVTGSNPVTPTDRKHLFRSGCSAVRLARQLRELEVAGSNPVSPTTQKSPLSVDGERGFASRTKPQEGTPGAGSSHGSRLRRMGPGAGCRMELARRSRTGQLRSVRP